MVGDKFHNFLSSKLLSLDIVKKNDHQEHYLCPWFVFLEARDRSTFKFTQCAFSSEGLKY